MMPLTTVWLFTNCWKRIEKVSGKEYSEYIHEEITSPCGMDRTRTPLTMDNYKEMAGFYISGVKGRILPEYSNAIPSSGVISTAEDMAKYYCMLANGGVFEGKQIVPPEALELMFGAEYPLRRKPFYAMGLRKHAIAGHMVCDHGGELHGVAAYGGFVKDGCGIAVLCNESEWDMEDVLNICYAYLLDLPLEEDLIWTKLSGKTFSAPQMLFGDYVGHVGDPIHIRVYARGGKLYARIAGEVCRLEYCEQTVFAAISEESGKRVNFLRFFIHDGRAWAVKCGSLLYHRV